MDFFSKPQSSAIKIVNPNTQDEQKTQPRKDSVQRQCRNIMIYGSCKYQDKGCPFSHPPAPEAPTSPQSPPTVGTILTAQAINAPVFVPKTQGIAIPNATSPPPMSVSRQSSLTSPSPPSPVVQSNYPAYEVQESYHEYTDPNDGVNDHLAQQMGQLDELGQPYHEDSHYGYVSEYDAHSAYYTIPSPVFLRQPLNYHLYTTTIPSSFVQSASDSHFVPSTTELRTSLQRRSETIRGTAAPDLNLPEEIQGYHTFVPLDAQVANANERRKFGNWFSTTYRAIATADGVPYALRRIENFRLVQQAAFVHVDKWNKIRHPSIVTIHEAFTTRAFNDNSLVVVYTYHANAQTLYDAYCKSKPPGYQSHPHGRGVFQGRTQPPAVPERTLWSYIVQLASAIKKVHDAGMAVRTIDLTKVLVTGQNRVRISSCGVVELLTHDTPQDMAMLQQEDLNMLGRLILCLCCANPAAANPQGLHKSLENMGRTYGNEVSTIVLYLFGKNGHHRTVDQLLDLIKTHFVIEMNDALSASDRLENELLTELENARLVRLLCKFGFINERPEFARDPRWSETGDRYPIKLFRDYVFHQVDENGNPVVHLSHVLTCLNKLDAGTDEKIMLVSRDEQSCLVVSYSELKQCIDSAFSELSRASSLSTPHKYR